MGRQLRILAGMILGVGLGGCFTDSINSRPKVSIDPTPEIVRGVSFTFTASAMDDQGPLSYEWGSAHGPCEEPPPADEMLGQARDSSYKLTVEDAGVYCVWVVVHDPQNAQSKRATREFTLENLAPHAQITPLPETPMLATQVPLYSALQFTASKSTDPDSHVPLTFEWSLKRPDGMTVTPAACKDPPVDVCFTVDMPGRYELTLTATDGDGAPDTTDPPLKIDVAEDRPPCIVATTPMLSTIFRAPSDEVPFSVTGVDDDGDPLPPSSPGTTFSWSWSLNDAAFRRVVSYDQQSWSVPAQEYRTGDTLRVRVEVHDRQTRPELDDCLKAQPQPLICYTGGSCERWFTWTVWYR